MAQIFGRNRRRGVVAGLIAAFLVFAVAGGLVLTGSVGTSSGASASPAGSGAIANASASAVASDVPSASASADASMSQTASPAITAAVETASASAAETGATPGATTHASAPAAASASTAPTTAPTGTLSPTSTPTHAATATPTTAPPDLRFGAVVVPTVKCGLSLHVSATVSNAGPGNAPAVPVLLVDTWSGHQDVSLRTNVVALSAGAAATASWDTAIREGCDVNHTMTVRIDPDNALVEVTHSNNSQSWSYHVQPTPDLSTTSLSAGHAACGHAFTVTAIVHNQGGAATPRASKLKFSHKVGSTLLQLNYIDIRVMASGEAFPVSATMGAPIYCGQLHTLSVEVDYEHVIDEWHEDNNIQTVTFTP